MSNTQRLAAIEKQLLALCAERKERCFDLLDQKGKNEITGNGRVAILKAKRAYDKEILTLRELKFCLLSRKQMKNISYLIAVARENEALPLLEHAIFGFLNRYKDQCDLKSDSWVDGCGVPSINDFMKFTFGDSFSIRGVDSYHGVYRLLSQGLHSLFGGDAKFGGHVRFAMPNATVFDPDRPVNYNARVGGNKCSIISALYGFLIGSGYDDGEIRQFMGSRHFTLTFIKTFACVVTQIDWAAVADHLIMYYKSR